VYLKKLFIVYSSEDRSLTVISLMQLANFRYHGNSGLSKPNFTYTILLPDPDNPTLKPKITTLSYTEPELAF